jgi:predicted phosphodiesterase
MRNSIRRAVILPVIFTMLTLIAPFAAYAGPEKFAIVSDTHIGAPFHTAYPDIIRILDDEGIDMIVHAGDAVNNPGSAYEWERFLEITGPGKTLYLAPGNHDIRGEGSFETFLQFFDAPYSSFADGDTLFVFLCTEMPGEESRISGDQLAWLKTELARPFRYKLVFMHEPLFPALPRHGLDRHRSERDDLHRLFVRSGVSLVVAGHDHVYERAVRDGVVYVICGRAGGASWPGKTGNSLGYILAERTGDFYVLTVMDVNGTVRDRIEVVRTEAPAGEAKIPTPDERRDSPPAAQTNP